jgi:UDP-3-O-[3-hydroxymyristoyl] N-acetylglucosamine deacetylase
MDGSAAPFVYLIRSAGIFEQRDERQTLRIRRKISVVDGDRSISIEPSRDFRVSYAVDFDHPAIRRQEIELVRCRRSASSATSRRRARSASCAKYTRSGTPASRAAARSRTRSCSTTRRW